MNEMLTLECTIDHIGPQIGIHFLLCNDMLVAVAIQSIRSAFIWPIRMIKSEIIVVVADGCHRRIIVNRRR